MNNYPRLVRANDATHRQLKILAAVEDREIGDILEEAVALYVASKKEKEHKNE